MATHRCVTECFHNSHRYDVGAEATFNPGDLVPEHFELISRPTAEPQEEDAEEEQVTGRGKGKGTGK